MNNIPAQSPSAPRFIDDERGAIAVMGLMIGAVLAALLFHMMNCGFGILWREHAQDAADATAYEAALWNARGMNTIVAINIFIAIVMAVLICWRILIIITAVILGLVSIACPFEPEFCEVIPAVERGLETEIKNDPKVAGRVYQVMRMLHDGQKVVAAATPIMGTLASVAEAAHYDAKFGIGFGTQLLPTIKLPSGKKPPKSCRPAKTKWNTKAGNMGDLLGKPVSLPVSEIEDLSTLCGKAGKEIFVLLFEIIGKVGGKLHLEPLEKLGSGSASEPFANVMQEITKSAPDLFCGDFGTLIDSEMDEHQNNRCGKDKACNDKANKGKKKPNTSQVGKVDPADASWTKVWDVAGNGNLFMQSWSYVKTERTAVAGLDRGVNIVDFVPGGTTTAGVPIDKDGSTFAEAEMYFDCKANWSDASCMDTAPWRMAWRARLRRVHDPVDFIASDFQATLTDALYGGISGQFSGALGGKFTEVTKTLNANSGRLIQIKPDSSFENDRNRIARTLVPFDPATGALTVRSAAAWVADESAAGVTEMIH